ncbi:molybdopterin-dependent oxidoreductase (plasmid) [Deinococcus radiomollis]|uniref:molybdopterin-dependent oxidoreductase n=1 Tax=Deinococcus radiomollis TaxID=468916 RepID=UPI0038912715
MRTLLPALLVAALVGGPVLAQTTPAAPAPASMSFSTATTAITLGGQLTAPRSFVLADLQALPGHEVSLTYMAAGKSVTHTFKGVLLSDLLTAARPAFDPRVRNASLTWYVLAQGADGYAALFSLGEIDPGFGNRGVLLAYAQDGQPLPASDGAVQLVVPGDLKGGRYVSSLVRLTVLPAALPAPN